jgi:hypothetical protein
MKDWFKTGDIKDAPRELLETFYMKPSRKPISFS